MTTYQTLRERLEYHYAESKKIWDSAHDGKKFKTLEDEKSWNFHVAEARILYARILKDFPEEEKAYQAEGKARTELAKKRLTELEAKDQELQTKKLLEEIRSLPGE
jgi:hypothetical protein